MTKRLLTASVAAEDRRVKPVGGTGAARQRPAPAGPAEATGQLLHGVDGLSGTQRRLLEAAVSAFAAHGFHGTTTRAIATRAGLSPAGLYVHYPSKGALLAQLSTLGHEAAAALVTRSLGAAGDAPADVRLHRTVAAFVRWHAENHLVARVVQYELRSLDDVSRAMVGAMRRTMEEQVEAVVREGIGAGVLAAADPRQAARVVLSLAVDVARWFDPAGRQAPDRLGDAYADLALRMLAPLPVPTAPAAREDA